IDVVNEASLARFDANGSQVVKRPLFLNPEAINGQDCRDDQRIRLPVELSDFYPHSLVEIWASTHADCRGAENRTEDDHAACWRVGGPVALQPLIHVDLPVRAILSPAADASVCGNVDLTSIHVQ